MLTESVTTHPWRLQRRVLPQHTDHGGVMWHGAYVAWLEEARVEAIAAAGMSYAQLSEEGYEMELQCDNVVELHQLGSLIQQMTEDFDVKVYWRGAVDGSMIEHN